MTRVGSGVDNFQSGYVQDDDAALLQEALTMSMAEPAAEAAANANAGPSTADVSMADINGGDVDQDLAYGRASISLANQ